MKPAPFDYYAPTSVSEALDRLEQLGYSGKVLAGGQSLIPAMNFRVARPGALVDLNNIPELFYIKPAPQGGYLIGTMTRDVDVENHPEIRKKYNILNQAFVHWAHAQIRNRGTFGGAIAHADPAGQLPGVAVALEFRLKVVNKKGERWVNADDFFMGPFATVIEPRELLTEIHIPDIGPLSGSSYQQIARTHGAQFQVAACVKVVLDRSQKFQKANIVMLAVGERALLAHEAGKMLVGQAASNEQAIKAAAHNVALKEIDPGTDIHATAEYRRYVTEVLVERALKDAATDAIRRGG